MASGRWNSLLLLIVVIIATKVAAGDDECVIEVEINNFTFSVNYTFVSNNSSACKWKSSMMMTVEPCEATEPSLASEMVSIDRKSGTFSIPEGGWYKLWAWGWGTSHCFVSLGQDFGSLNVNIDFTNEALSMTIKDDVRVKNSTLILYRVDPKIKDSASNPCKDKYALEEIRRVPPVTPPITFKVQGPFSPSEDCLCFEVELEGFNKVDGLSYNNIISNTCKMPVNVEEKTPRMQGWVIGLIATVGVILILIAVVVAVTRQRWKRKPAKDIERPKPPVSSPTSEVLLLYAWDVATRIHLQDLRNTLAKYWKITELSQYDDHHRHGDTKTRLEDENAWVEGKVVREASVRVVLVESKGLHSELLSILEGKSEEEELDREKGLRRFALRSTLALETCNYGRVFVVRFGEGGGPSGREELNFLVGNRRYVLPGHLQALVSDLLGAGTDQHQKKEGTMTHL